jgi:hypothetical protein
MYGPLKNNDGVEEVQVKKEIFFISIKYCPNEI